MIAAVAGGLVGNGCRTAPANGTPSAADPLKSRPAARGANGKYVPSQQASAHAHYAAGVLHELNGEIEPALAEFQRAVVLDPGNETLILEVTLRFLQHKQPEKALEILLASTTRGDVGGEVFARLGSVYSRLGRHEEALAANRTAVKKSPRSPAGYQNLFLGLLQAKQADESLKLIGEAGRLPGVEAGFLMGTADLYQHYLTQFPTQRKAVEGEALAVLGRAEALRPTDPQLRLRLADGLYHLGETQRATKLYLSLVEQFEEIPLVRDNIRSRLADIYLRGDDPQAARTQLEAIVRDDPSNAQAYYFLGSLAYDGKRWAEAVGYFQKTLLFSPNFERAYFDLAAAQLATGDPAGVLLTLWQRAGKFRANFLSEYLAALAEGRQKNYEAALKHFTTAEVIAQADEPQRLTAEYYFEVGIAFERKGDHVPAAKYFERALELKPEFPEAQNYLGYMWAERGEQLERARGLIAKALIAEPKSAAYLDSMGWVLFKLNKPQEALDYLLQAIALSEEPDATLFDHLGDIYLTLRESDKAREAWRKSLAVEASEGILQKLNSSKTP